MTVYEKAQMAVFNYKLQMIEEIAAATVTSALFVELDAEREDYDSLLSKLRALECKLPEMIELTKTAKKITGEKQ